MFLDKGNTELNSWRWKCHIGVGHWEWLVETGHFEWQNSSGGIVHLQLYSYRFRGLMEARSEPESNTKMIPSHLSDSWFLSSFLKWLIRYLYIYLYIFLSFLIIKEKEKENRIFTFFFFLDKKVDESVQRNWIEIRPGIDLFNHCGIGFGSTGFYWCINLITCWLEIVEGGLEASSNPI